MLALLTPLTVAGGCGEGPRPRRPAAPPAEAPATWDLGALPPAKVLREYQTPAGVRVQVLAKGQGEELARGQSMDVQLVGYVRTGTIFERDTRLGMLPEAGREIQGFVEGLAGMKVREKRRLLIPSALAFGAQGRGNIPPHTDVIFDAMRVHLVIEELKEGTGPEIRRGMEVTVHYSGTLESGVEFDSSYRKGEPFTFRLPANPRAPAGVIEGWVRGVLGMRVGGVRRLWIPYHLAYAERGSGQSVGPYANLNFVVEVLDAREL